MTRSPNPYSKPYSKPHGIITCLVLPAMQTSAFRTASYKCFPFWLLASWFRPWSKRIQTSRNQNIAFVVAVVGGEEQQLMQNTLHSSLDLEVVLHANHDLGIEIQRHQAVHKVVLHDSDLGIWEFHTVTPHNFLFRHSWGPYVN